MAKGAEGLYFAFMDRQQRMAGYTNLQIQFRGCSWNRNCTKAALSNLLPRKKYGAADEADASFAAAQQREASE